LKKTLLILFLLSNLLFAQDPAGIEWKQIQTDQYKIIFPEEISDHANNIANRLEYVSPKIGFYLQESHQPILDTFKQEHNFQWLCHNVSLQI